MNRIKQHIASASPLFWVVLIVVILGLSFGGVSAYLTWSSDGLENQFVTAEHPEISVNKDYCISVPNPGYAVFLRAAVVVNWENTQTNTIISDIPKAGTDYNLTLDDTLWEKGNDGFYYYKNRIICGSNASFTTQPVVSIEEVTQKAGYRLKVTVLAQTIQAVGTTDADDTVTAVQDAWPR